MTTARTGPTVNPISSSGLDARVRSAETLSKDASMTRPTRVSMNSNLQCGAFSYVDFAKLRI